MLKLDTVATLAKSMATKAVKGDGGTEITNCELKFTGMPILQRDVIDELLGMPIGWSALSLYDEQGAPLRALTISAMRSELRATGKLCGPRGEPTLALLQANLADVELWLTPNGAIASGLLVWTARGDEVEDASPLLGKLCRAEFDITDGEQADMFERRRVSAEQSTKNAMRMMDVASDKKPMPPKNS